MTSLNATRRRLRMSAEIQVPFFNLMTISICFVKFLATMLFLAGAGMMTNNDEWHIIGATALGGGFGAVVGVFLAVASNASCLWQILALRWAVNFMCALVFGSPLALWINSLEPVSNGTFPGPILCLASGGATGILGVAALQIFMPRILRYIERKVDAATQRVWSDAATPPKSPPTNTP